MNEQDTVNPLQGNENSPDTIDFDQKEAIYQFLFQNAHDAIFILVDGSFVFFNSKTESLTGYPATDLNHIPFFPMVHPGDRSRVVQETKISGERTLSFRIVNRIGEELWCQAGFVSITWDRKPAILMFLRDFTRQKLLEDQLQQAQKMEALGTLVAGVAHEINNPINLVMYNLPLLKNVFTDLLPVLEKESKLNADNKYGGLTYEFLSENLLQLVSDIDMATNRIAKTVSDLKNFSKQSDSEEKEPMGINTAVENALRLIQSTLKKSKINLVKDLADNLPDIEGSPHNIEQVILNIIINAAQAIDCDHGEISISTEYQIKDGNILISISDNGRGINPVIANRIFDPFVTDKRAQGGTGLGLSVSYNLINAHKGTISFKNRQDGGTLFQVFLPVILKGKTYKILIADDDELVRSILVETLTKNRNYLIDEAFNGIEACIKLGTYKPDLLVLDILMPQMDGLEVCRTITKNEDLSDLKVLITTGYPDHPKVVQTKNLGFTNVLGKPFNLKKFMAEVDKILTT
jgi:PAS domain S-box-containing protein